MSDLLTLEDLAQMWRCSTRYARDTLVKLPGFPAPAPGCGVRNRVWNREEIQAYRLSGRPAHYAQGYSSAGSSL